MQIRIARITAAAIVLVLAACAQNAHKPPTDTSFLRTSPDSIVVLGIRSVTPHELFWIEHYPNFRMVWEPSNSPGSKTIMSELIVDTAGDFLGIKTGGAGDAAWHVMRVPAGTYKLRRMTVIVGKDTYHTTFSFPHFLFTLKPGEVRYIGDLHFDVKSFPVQLAKVTRNDAMAKAELAKYPGILVAPVFQQPSVVLAPNGRPQMLKVTQ